jgi:hypothetical protein
MNQSQRLAEFFGLTKSASVCGANARGGGGFQVGNTCGSRMNKEHETGNDFRYLKDFKQLYQKIKSMLPESFDEEKFEEEVGGIDDAVLSTAFGEQDYDLSGFPEVAEVAKKIREEAEFVPGGKPFEQKSDRSHVRISQREMDEDDLHDNHESRLWVDGADSDSAVRSGISGAKSIDDLVGYFSSGDSLGRYAFFGDQYLVEYEGEESGDTPFEGEYGESLVHPKKIVQQRLVTETDFLRKLVDAERERRGDNGGVIAYDSHEDRIVRIVYNDARLTNRLSIEYQ